MLYLCLMPLKSDLDSGWCNVIIESISEYLGWKTDSEIKSNLDVTFFQLSKFIKQKALSWHGGKSS